MKMVVAAADLNDCVAGLSGSVEEAFGYVVQTNDSAVDLRGSVAVAQDMDALKFGLSAGRGG